MRSESIQRRAFLNYSLGIGIAAIATALPHRHATGHSISKGALEVVHPWTFEQDAAGSDAVIGMEIRNTGPNADRILAAETFEAASSEIVAASRNKGKPVIEIPPRSSIDLHAGGPHILLRGMKTSLTPDTYFTIALLFERAGVVRIDVNVEERRR
jgi:copper(I)-binding protein